MSRIVLVVALLFLGAEAVIGPRYADALALRAKANLKKGLTASTIELLDVRSGAVVKRLRPRKTYPSESSTVPSPAFSPNGQWVAGGDAAGVLRVWDVKTGRCEHEVPAHTKPINRLTWSPNSEFIATAGDDARAVVFKVDADQTLAELQHQDAVEDVAFSPDGYLVATASGGLARTWSRSGYPRSQLKGHKAGVWRIAFAPDGETVATVSLDGTARLWSLLTGLERSVITHPGRVDPIAISAGRARGKGDRHRTVWDIEQARQLPTKTTTRSFLTAPRHEASRSRRGLACVPGGSCSAEPRQHLPHNPT